MRRSLRFLLLLPMTILLAGCGQKFEPTESTVFVTSKGIVQSAVMESFDKSYYDFGELSEDAQKAVKAFCLDRNEESVSITSLTNTEDSVALLMEYQTAEDYAAFNEVLLFSGTFSEAVEAGYLPDELHDPEGQLVELDMEKLGQCKTIVTEESICLQTSGKIRYMSENVMLLDKKLAKAVEAGKSHPAFVLYK